MPKRSTDSEFGRSSGRRLIHPHDLDEVERGLEVHERVHAAAQGIECPARCAAQIVQQAALGGARLQRQPDEPIGLAHEIVDARRAGAQGRRDEVDGHGAGGGDVAALEAQRIGVLLLAQAQPARAARGRLGVVEDHDRLAALPGGGQSLADERASAGVAHGPARQDERQGAIDPVAGAAQLGRLAQERARHVQGRVLVVAKGASRAAPAPGCPVERGGRGRPRRDPARCGAARRGDARL